MIEVRTYDEDAHTAAAFTSRVWSHRYQRHVPVIDWSADYFDWQLLWPRHGGRDYLVAAYEGSTLVGTLFGEAMTFQLRGEPFDATTGSWLTVDPAYRRQGVARLIADEMRRRLRERGAKFMFGFGLLGTDGPSFWESRPDTRTCGTVGFWVRLFDARAVADWSLTWRDRLLTRLAAPFSGGAPPSDASPDLRAFAVSDLDACLRLAHAFEQQADLGYRWTAARLSHQLVPGAINRTWVIDRGRGVEGFVNYYLLAMTGRTRVTAAVIDIIACGDLPRSDRRRLLTHALARMAHEGAAFAMALRVPVFSSRDLVRAGFGPTPRDSRFLAAFAEPALSLDGVRRVYVHWR